MIRPRAYGLKSPTIDVEDAQVEFGSIRIIGEVQLLYFRVQGGFRADNFTPRKDQVKSEDKSALIGSVPVSDGCNFRGAR